MKAVVGAARSCLSSAGLFLAEETAHPALNWRLFREVNATGVSCGGPLPMPWNPRARATSDEPSATQDLTYRGKKSPFQRDGVDAT
jgi:hypothetical protein